MTDSTPKAPVPTIDELTAAAKSLSAEILELDAKKAVLDAAYGRAKADKVIALGNLLIQIKASLSHGGWYPWLAATGFKPASAQNYIKIAKLHSSNPQSIRDFGYTQLLLLLPLSDELPAFLAALTVDGTNPAGLSVRVLHEYVKHWHKNHSLLSEKPPVTIDAGTFANDAATVEEPDTVIATSYDESFSAMDAVVEENTVPTLPAKYVEMTLFDLPALPTPPQYELPPMILKAVDELSLPAYLVLHAVHDELPSPSILLVLATPFATWVQPLLKQATANIITRLPLIRAGLVKLKPTIILYLGDDVANFASVFSKFGEVNVPYPKKASASYTSKLSK